MQLQFDFNTPAGIRKAARWLLDQAKDAPPKVPKSWPCNAHPVSFGHLDDGHHMVRAGPLRVLRTQLALEEAARRLRGKAEEARPHFAEPELPGSPMYRLRDMDTWDCVRLCGGDKTKAAEVIERQLAAQGESMDPADAKRCRRALELLRKAVADEECKLADKEQEGKDWKEMQAAKPLAGAFCEVEPGTPLFFSDRFQLHRGHALRYEENRWHPFLKTRVVALIVEATHKWQTGKDQITRWVALKKPKQVPLFSALGVSIPQQAKEPAA